MRKSGCCEQLLIDIAFAIIGILVGVALIVAVNSMIG